jgi:hypothetical protein
VETRSQISIGAAQARSDLHGAGQHDDLGGRYVVLLQEHAEQVRVGGGDALALQRLRAVVGALDRHRQRQPAAAEVERAQRLEAGRRAARGELQALFFQHVQADQSQIADVLLHQVRNVVVAHEQHIERHVLAEAHELILAARELQAAARQQVHRRVGQPAGLLHRKLDAHVSLSMLRAIDALRRQGIATIALGQVARHAADGGDADAGLAMNLAIGQAAPQALDHGPAVGHRLQFRRRAQVAQEGAAFLDAAQRDDGGDQVALGQGFLARGQLPVGFHCLRPDATGFQCINVLVH